MVTPRKLEKNMTEKKKIRILYIEDELAMMEGTIEILRLDYEVEAVRDADLALEILNTRSTQFSLIVLDVRMPQGKQVRDPNHGRTMGVELAKRIGENFPSIPIIIYTVVNDANLHEKLRDVGVKAVVMKSYSASQLEGEIEKHISK